MKNLLVLLLLSVYANSFSASFEDIAESENLSTTQLIFGKCLVDNGIETFDAISISKKTYYTILNTYDDRSKVLFKYCRKQLENSETYKELVEKKQKEAETKRNEALIKKREIIDFVMKNSKKLRGNRSNLMLTAICEGTLNRSLGYGEPHLEIIKNSNGETVVCNISRKKVNKCLLDVEVFFRSSRVVYNGKPVHIYLDSSDVQYIRDNYKKELQSLTIQKGMKTRPTGIMSRECVKYRKVILSN
jgi:hypothetical protein